MSGQIDTAVVSLPSVIGQLSGKSVKALAITSARRSPVLKDIPTASEAGVADFDATPWWGILGPPKMDTALRTKIAADINSVLQLEDFRLGLERQGAEIFVTPDGDFERLIASDLEKWRALVKTLKLN